MKQLPEAILAHWCFCIEVRCEHIYFFRVNQGFYSLGEEDENIQEGKVTGRRLLRCFITTEKHSRGCTVCLTAYGPLSWGLASVFQSKHRGQGGRSSTLLSQVSEIPRV